jgi:adenosylhomocysteine nucleosidase
LSAVGIVSALGVEARHLAPFSRLSNIPAPLEHGALLAVSGIGCAAAARSARTLIEAGATALTSWGMAGGLDVTLPCGAVLLPNEIVSTEGKSFSTARQWRERLAQAVGACCSVAAGKLVTTTRPIASVAEKARLFRETGAAAVDMESLAVAEVASEYGMPFIAVRVIVDTATDALPRAVIAAGSDGPLRIGRLLRELARSPADVVGLIHLARRYRVAGRSLASVARNGSLTHRIFSAGPESGFV